MRKSNRLHGPGSAHATPALRRRANPVLALQRSIGNRAVGQVLAREPVATGTIEIAGVGKIKVKGGNLQDWTGQDTFDTVEVTSEKGKHSAKLEKLANARTRTPVKVMIAPAHTEGEHLNVGGGTQLDIQEASIRYSVADGVETWKVVDFERVKRTKITRTIQSG
jgi:hypothetical protein